MSYAVFIVEDSPLIQFVLTANYEQLGFRVAATAETAEAAFAYISAHHTNLNLISLDITLLDEENGVALAKRIRQKNIHTPILFISGNVDYMSEAATISNSCFLPKPVSTDDIRRTLQQMGLLPLGERIRAAS